MADLRIKNDPEQVEQCAAKIKTQSDMMENLMNEMQGKVTSLQSYFKSNSGTNYVEKYTNVKRDIDNSITEIRAVVSAMEQAANDLRTADKQTDTKTDSLNTQSVFTN